MRACYIFFIQDICERVSDCESNEVVETVLEVITYVGTVLSLIGIIVTVITLLAFRYSIH